MLKTLYHRFTYLNTLDRLYAHFNSALGMSMYVKGTLPDKLLMCWNVAMLN